MNRTQLVNADVKVSRLCLGMMNFCPRTNEKDSTEKIVRRLKL